MEVSGKIIEITPIQEGTSRVGNPWRKRMYVIETQDNYPKKIAFTVFGSDRVNQYDNMYRAGDLVRVSFDLESREYNGRWYTDASAWRIDRGGEQPQQPSQPSTPDSFQGSSPAPFQGAAPVPPGPTSLEPSDDLPF